jgi:2-keto-4-pentenoate hydratase/2-oxohepta-3-ene-1,7-dioic acid hydratase in catechol pathway
MKLVATRHGVGRLSGDGLELLELPHRNVGELFADDPTLATTAAVRARVTLDEAELLAPVPTPRHFVLAGSSYAAHTAEVGLSAPSEGPSFMLVNADALDGPFGEIILPADAPDRVDYEAEIAIVLSGDASDIAPEDAWTRIGGLMIVNDVSERREQMQAMAGPERDLPRIIHAKRRPTFKPSGPWVVTSDEYGYSTPDLAIQTTVNGEVRQADRTRSMRFSFEQIISYVSRRISLVAGDVITTGTPAGVAQGNGKFLRAGDLVEITVEGIGQLTNRVAARHEG